MPNRTFRNDGGRTFQDVTASGGFGQLQKGHGVAFGDVDRGRGRELVAAPKLSRLDLALQAPEHVARAVAVSLGQQDAELVAS